MIEQLRIFLDQGITNGVGLGVLTVAMLLQAGWNLYHHFRKGEYFPKIEFLCDLLFKAQTETHWIVEIVCAVRNKGIAGHQASDLNFRVHGLELADSLQNGSAAINNQTKFPHLIRSGVWQRRRDFNDIIEAGTTQYYRHVGVIPKGKYIAAVVHGSMKYPQTRFGKLVEHTCNRLIKIPENEDEARAYAHEEMDRLQFVADTHPVGIPAGRARR